MPNSVWLQDLTWQDAKKRIARSGGTILLPVGSTEQHGPHLPLGTDTLLAIALAEEAAGRTGALVAPPLWFGWSPHHMILPGTVTVRPEVLVELLSDVIRSLAAHGFRNFLLVNGHRLVNVPWLQIAGERAKRELGARVALFDPAYMSKEIASSLGFGPVGHAEEIESSHLWFCRPDLARMDRARDNPVRPGASYRPDPRDPRDTLCYLPGSPAEMAALSLEASGTIGEPSRSSRAGGEKYHRHLVDRLVRAIGDLRSRGRRGKRKARRGAGRSR